MYMEVQVLREAGCRKQPDRDSKIIAARFAVPPIIPPIPTQCPLPAYFNSPAVTAMGSRFCGGGSGQVAKALKEQGGL